MICPPGSELFQVDEQADGQDTTKLTVAFLTILGMHLRYLMVNSLGVPIETRILFSVTFESLSKCPTLLPFFQFVETEVTKHTPVLYPCSKMKVNFTLNRSRRPTGVVKV